jgi:hypothetical protein
MLQKEDRDQHLLADNFQMSPHVDSRRPRRSRKTKDEPPRTQGAHLFALDRFRTHRVDDSNMQSDLPHLRRELGKLEG